MLQEEKGVTEDEMVGWHQQLNGPESEQSLGDGEGQGSLVWCSPQDCKESVPFHHQNNIRKIHYLHSLSLQSNTYLQYHLQNSLLVLVLA